MKAELMYLPGAIQFSQDSYPFRSYETDQNNFELQNKLEIHFRKTHLEIYDGNAIHSHEDQWQPILAKVDAGTYPAHQKMNQDRYDMKKLR